MHELPADGQRPRNAGGPTTLSIRVVPGASKTEIVGVSAGTLKVRLAAPPTKGKANAELVKLLARALGVTRREVEIVAGHTARLKKVQIHGADPNAVSELMGEGDQHMEWTGKTG
ncbi:MAG: DUF167 domain-containing protein [Anaerolineae bacterium]|nr:DUF167 domain-containing protein [Anaerolineae bacterium]